jgi:hypothetical protein
MMTRRGIPVDTCEAKNIACTSQNKWKRAAANMLGYADHQSIPFLRTTSPQADAMQAQDR